MENKKLYLIILLIFISISAYCAPTIIDFSSIDEYCLEGTYDENIATIDIAHFSNSLYTHPDGFKAYEGAAYNWYGERREFITFENSVHLISIDTSALTTAPLPVSENMIFEMYNESGSLINTLVVPVSTTYQTISFDEQNVSKLLIDFTNGSEHYSDGREHGWYLIDNLIFDATVNIPEPACVICFLLSLVCLFYKK